MGWCLRGALASLATLSASIAIAGSMGSYQNSDIAGPGPYWNAMSDRGFTSPCCAPAGGQTRYVPVPVRSADDYYAYDGGYSSAYQASGAAYSAPPSYGRPSFVSQPPLYHDPVPAYQPAGPCCRETRYVDGPVYRSKPVHRRVQTKRSRQAARTVYRHQYVERYVGPGTVQYVERYAEPAPVQYVETYAPPPPVQYVETYSAPPPVQYVQTYPAPPPRYVEPYPQPAPYHDPYYVGEPRFEGGYANETYLDTRTAYAPVSYGYQDRYAPPVYDQRNYGPPPQGEFHVRSYGGAEQHYGAPRCRNPQGRPCRCDEFGALMPGEITLGQGFMYTDGGVGPIPDSGYVGGGGGGGGSSGGITFNQNGGGASAYASANAYSSSSSNVTINYGGGHGGGHGGYGGGGHGGYGGGGHGGGGCNTCGGGGSHGGGGHH